MVMQMNFISSPKKEFIDGIRNLQTIVLFFFIDFFQFCPLYCIRHFEFSFSDIKLIISNLKNPKISLLFKTAYNIFALFSGFFQLCPSY